VRSGNPERLSFVIAGVLTVALRFLYSGLAALFAPRLNLDPVLIRSNHFTENLMQPSAGPLYAWLGVWERFDTLWYIHIAANGYDRPDAVVFYPLYPVLVRIVSLVMGQPLVAALLVSSVSAFFLFWGLHKLLSLDLPAEVVNRSLLLYSIWPASFIFFAGYIESLVIALMVWSIYFGRTNRWWYAGVAGFLAGMAKPVGSLVLVPLALLAWRERKWRALPAALCLLSTPAFLLWLRFSGRILPMVAYKKYWRTEVAPPWATLSDLVRDAFLGRPLMLRIHLVILAVVFVLAVWKKLRPEYALYVVAAMCFLLLKKSDPSQQQWTRYILILFPAPVNLSCILGSRALFAAGAMLLFIVNIFLMWHFLGWSLVV
jgi:hypothetical protein